jgi:hypothetical protein
MNALIHLISAFIGGMTITLWRKAFGAASALPGEFYFGGAIPTVLVGFVAMGTCKFVLDKLTSKKNRSEDGS